MTKATKDETTMFGQRLLELRKARGFTQQELADEVGLSRRMVAYYESQSKHPPTTHLPAFAKALKVSTDELLGTVAVKRQTAREGDSRLKRRFQQIEKLDSAEKRQIVQLIDVFIERGRYKSRSHA
jgi:transcriptional regulator with XRE-family HTH domain